ncbi:MAG: hypothetical protein Q8P62_01325 [Candidatus Peregrinibacteria bacterium]|nr:hypothetical protein [Candidatus Peregrinibacteria bacterium]
MDIGGLGDGYIGKYDADPLEKYAQTVEELKGVKTVREINRMVETEPLEAQVAIWRRISDTLGCMSESFSGRDQDSFIEHSLAMMQGGPNFQVTPSQSWIYRDEYRQSGNYYIFSRGGHDFGVVMLKYAFDVGEEVPYCVIDHIQGVRRGSDSNHGPVFPCNVLEGIASYVVEKSRVLIENGWKIALKFDGSDCIWEGEPVRSLGVRDRFFDSKRKEIRIKSSDGPNTPLRQYVHDLNPRRKRVREILGHEVLKNLTPIQS